MYYFAPDHDTYVNYSDKVKVFVLTVQLLKDIQISENCNIVTNTSTLAINLSPLL